METSNKPSNPSAFPNTIVNNQGIIIGGKNGMTLRDYFAGKFLQGHISSEYYAGTNNSEDNKNAIAGLAYDFADAMLKQREV